MSHIDVHPGQLYETHFLARNLLDTPMVGQAVPSVATALLMPCCASAIAWASWSSTAMPTPSAR